MSDIISPNEFRTHTCNDLRENHNGIKVTLSGWVHTRRDHGGLIFIDLRDRWGITQLTFNPDKNKAAWEIAETLRSEYVITVSGKVNKRPDDMKNTELDTGDIEVEAETINIVTQSKTPPFSIAQDDGANEEVRLKHRFIDLRKPHLQEIMRRRHEFIRHVRQYFHENNFLEIQTPLLANSSPEGARDFVVPSRLHPGKFYALPQAPQQFKQLLMVAGVDRYFQIAPCFRDEDPRIDRHPGVFYQIDMEMSFVTQEDVWNIIEPLMIELTEKFSDKKLVGKPFPRIPWRQAMNKYGSDKPDLRFDNFITDLTKIAKKSEFKVFKDAEVVHALHVAGAAEFSRKDISHLEEQAKIYGASGLAYILIKDEPISPILKFIDDKIIQEIIEQTNAKKGDAIFFGAGDWLTVCKSLGAVRSSSAEKLNLNDPDKAAWVWISDFPMYDFNEETNQIDFSHNPFSMPKGGMESLQTKNPLDIIGHQYDLALNGFEISSGAIRNHEPETMYRAFEIAGYTKDQVDDKFGGMISAFAYGAPPHGGLAPGLDRLMMVLWDLKNIRDIYAFPKNGQAQDLMMNAPSEIDQKQLDDLHLKLNLPPQK